MNNKPQASKKMRKGDKVIAISGNDRGQTGTILSINGDKVVVQGLNVRKKHVKRSQANPQGGILELEKPIHISKLKVCTKDDKPVKLKVKVDEKRERHLYYIDGDQETIHRSVKKSKTQNE